MTTRNTTIKDRFVFGLSDVSTQKVLLSGTKLTLEQAHTKAQAREQAGLHTQTINPGHGASTAQVDQDSSYNQKV